MTKAVHDLSFKKKRDILLKHPLLPYVLRAVNDVDGALEQYIPPPSVYEDYSGKQEVTQYLLDYLSVLHEQNEVAKQLYNDSLEFCAKSAKEFGEEDNARQEKNSTSMSQGKRKSSSQSESNSDEMLYTKAPRVTTKTENTRKPRSWGSDQESQCHPEAPRYHGLPYPAQPYSGPIGPYMHQPFLHPSFQFAPYAAQANATAAQGLPRMPFLYPFVPPEYQHSFQAHHASAVQATIVQPHAAALNTESTTAPTSAEQIPNSN